MDHNIIDIPLDQYIKHNTRCSRKHNSQFLQIRHSSNTFGHFVFPTTAKEWNALPSNIISSNSIESFKKNLNKYLIDHYPTNHHAHWRDVPEGHYLPVCEQKQKLATLICPCVLFIFDHGNLIMQQEEQTHHGVESDLCIMALSMVCSCSYSVINY